ncbi:putative acetyl- carboxylase protein [Anopheles sinensis]|uniref:Putative acetyl-carboxylase protein n=1 Tax=Anopheles sinensis TaxID=74873 RepID=A0A084WM84_ANOSI|nr:putative acetyl- carboxylase protein [Anopheles sinensis]
MDRTGSTCTSVLPIILLRNPAYGDRLQLGSLTIAERNGVRMDINSDAIAPTNPSFWSIFINDDRENLMPSQPATTQSSPPLPPLLCISMGLNRSVASKPPASR